MISDIGHTVSIAVLDIFGLSVNAWFLYTIKTRTAPSNAIDVLQACKTVLCILALLCCVWLEFLICSSKICHGGKRIADDLLYFSTCLVFVTIAYIRRKACECRGVASVLVTQGYAIRKLLISATPSCMFVAATLALMANDSSSEMTKKYANVSQNQPVVLLTGASALAYEICHLIIFIATPLIVGSWMYFKIYTIVTQTARAVDNSVTNRHRDPSKTITMSMLVLLATMLSVWSVYIVVSFVSFFVQVDGKFFVYWKLITLILHPFGEGVLKNSGKTPVNKFKEILPDKPTRVYPFESPTSSVSYCEDQINSLAVRLPKLIEEKKTSVQMTEEDNDERRRTRRKSYIHPRKSVLVKNAEIIGLEFQEPNRVLDFYSDRPESGKLRVDFKNIEEAAANRQRARRLSTCLRFTAADDQSDDEIFQMYKTLYCRRGSKYSEKSKTCSIPSVTIPEMSDSDTDSVKRKHSTASSKSSSPSHKLWRKLFTTAKSARKFSKIRKHKTADIIVEELEDEKPGSHDKYRNKTSVVKEDPAVGEKVIPKMSVYSMTQQQKCLQKERSSLDSNPFPPTKNKKAEKKRSISCVNNVWLKSKEEKESLRKKSVSFISSVVVHGSSTSSKEEPLPRSISYDSRIQVVNYQQSEKGGKPEPRRSHGDLPGKRDSRSKPKAEVWRKELSREECIDILMKMKEYF